MKKRKSYYPLLLSFFLTVFSGMLAQGQNLNGQWRGGFVSAGGFLDDQTEYVLELEINGAAVSGYSYTYFIILGKRCYVICRLQGTYDKTNKSVVVTETEKVKSNTPPDFRDCLQTHMLTFFKQGETEQLKGNWKPATPKDNCGVGQTQLERKVLVKVAAPPPAIENKQPVTQNNNPATNTKPKAKSKTPPVAQNKTTPKPNNSTTRSTKPVAKTPTTSSKTSNNTKPPKKEDVAKNNSESKPVTIDKNLPSIEKPKAPPTINSTVIKGYENRSKQVIKTIVVDSATFRVDLYDNGQIDGDTVSLFFNGKLMVSKQRLSDKPITLKITIDPTREDNDLVMYAENLGSIPPNTSLMVVNVGGKRYEVNITSTDQTSGTVRFKLKE